LADYPTFTLTSVCADCHPYTPLGHAELAARF